MRKTGGAHLPIPEGIQGVETPKVASTEGGLPVLMMAAKIWMKAVHVVQAILEPEGGLPMKHSTSDLNDGPITLRALWAIAH